MKNHEGIGFTVGALIGAVLTGICVYFTKNPLSSAISLICALLGGWIGKSIDKLGK